jgi:hypothetical protein
MKTKTIERFSVRFRPFSSLCLPPCHSRTGWRRSETTSSRGPEVNACARPCSQSPRRTRRCEPDPHTTTVRGGLRPMPRSVATAGPACSPLLGPRPTRPHGAPPQSSWASAPTGQPSWQAVPTATPFPTGRRAWPKSLWPLHPHLGLCTHGLSASANRSQQRLFLNQFFSTLLNKVLTPPKILNHIST